MDAIVYYKVGKEAEKVREALYGIYPQATITDAAVASFDDGADGIPVKALTVGIEPVQAGSGDPSPDNICPISGWTGANIFNEVEYDAEATPKLSVSWESEAGTVYGGEYEVISGKLKKTMGMVDLGTLSWTYSGGRFIAYLPLAKQAASNFTPVNAICSMYPVNPIANTTSSDHDKIFGISVYRDLAIRDTSYTDPIIFKSAMSGVQLVYELAKPVEYDLTPQTLDTFYGQNNVWADTGNIKKLTYRADLGKYIDSHITTAVANALNA